MSDGEFEDDNDEITLENKGEVQLESDEQVTLRVLRPLTNGERQVVADLLGAAADVSVEKTETMRVTSESDRVTAAGPAMLAPLNAVGVGPATLANTLLAGLNATKHVMVQGKVRKLPDHSVRLKFLELAHKLRGDYPGNVKADQQVETYESRITAVMNRVKSKVSDAS